MKLSWLCHKISPQLECERPDVQTFPQLDLVRKFGSTTEYQLWMLTNCKLQKWLILFSKQLPQAHCDGIMYRFIELLDNRWWQFGWVMYSMHFNLHADGADQFPQCTLWVRMWTHTSSHMRLTWGGWITSNWAIQVWWLAHGSSFFCMHDKPVVYLCDMYDIFWTCINLYNLLS